jgi:ATP-dependent Lhr-like helicase
VRAHFQAELLLGRHGVLTKGAVNAEGVPGGFATLYKVLSAFEDAGQCQRGYFVESLGGAQFAAASTVDRLRSYLDSVDPQRPEYHAVVLAATDPANPYGAALGWPDDGESGHRPGRKAGALVALVDGQLVWFLERGGKSLLSFGSDADAQRAAAAALADLVGSGRVPSLLVERVNGTAVLDPGADDERSVVQDALTTAGFSRTPRGLRLR